MAQAIIAMIADDEPWLSAATDFAFIFH